ncbi:52 kDa repressor of the inhibitor of the protein kinase-like [Homalodisca vitripennis]|uniref:52 kDa repressor of the inhibitor of the protein kinase-like n=1 Tax=Homalodisca vitripennis TaxID=197043 RepID=UPI001EEC38C3|nr:52 kDa repressor of the inhibitor of the protein kinase-like [Homalodisca vitripennis]
MSTIWLKVLVAIDNKNKVLQARSTTLDVETKNLNDLIEELKVLRDRWSNLYTEAKLVAGNMAESVDCETDFKEKRLKKRKIFHDETRDGTEHQLKNEEERFRIDVFFKILDSVLGGLSQRFEFAGKISNLFQCLWKYIEEDDSFIEQQCLSLCQTYKEDIEMEILNEFKHLKSIHRTNLGEQTLQPLSLINALRKNKLDSSLFPNITTAIRLFCCIPVSVSQGERSFSLMKRIKSANRSTMTQDRMNDLSILAMESDLARSLKYDDIIEDFAGKKARRVVF